MLKPAARSTIFALLALSALVSARLWAMIGSQAPSRVGARTADAGNRRKPARKGPVVLYQVNLRETMALTMDDAEGRPLKGTQRRFDHFMRCHYTNVQHKMNPRLMRLLYLTGRHWPGRRLEVFSGYRHPSVAKNPYSPHMRGLACDFRVQGIGTSELRDYLRRRFDKVGVGYYPNSPFVHLDVRKNQSAFWIDYSLPGERSIYSATPNLDLKNGRADSYHPTKIDSSWAEDPATDGRSASASSSGKGPRTQ